MSLAGLQGGRLQPRASPGTSCTDLCPGDGGSGGLGTPPTAYSRGGWAVATGRECQGRWGLIHLRPVPGGDWQPSWLRAGDLPLVRLKLNPAPAVLPRRAGQVSRQVGVESRCPLTGAHTGLIWISSLHPGLHRGRNHAAFFIPGALFPAVGQHPSRDTIDIGRKSTPLNLTKMQRPLPGPA